MKPIIFTLLIALGAMAGFSTAFAVSEYGSYIQAPYVAIEDGKLTETGTNIYGQVNYNYAFIIHVKDDKCVSKVLFNKGSTVWYDITPFIGCTQDTEFGYGYSGARAPGNYYYSVQAVDNEGNTAIVKVPFTITPLP